MAETDVVILIKGARNTAETSDVDPAVGQTASQARQPILEERLDTRWVITQHPTDDGARRAGEFGVGMNRGIDRLTHTLLFDEKMGDTIHLALGEAIEECVPEDREYNESAVHLDLLVDVSEQSRIEIDGEVIQRNGTFWFEDGFAG